MKVYTVVVSDGDTGEIVEAIFSTREKADAYTKQYNLRKPMYDRGTVEEATVDPACEFAPCASFVIRMSRDGLVNQGLSYCREYTRPEEVRPLHMIGVRYGAWMDIVVHADNLESAIEIAQERRAQFLAEQAGIA